MNSAPAAANRWEIENEQKIGKYFGGGLLARHLYSKRCAGYVCASSGGLHRIGNMDRLCHLSCTLHALSQLWQMALRPMVA